MGIRGAAVATVAGYLLSMILAFALLLDKKQKVQIKIKGFHLQKQMIRRIFAFGLPSFIMNALSSFMLTFVNLFLVAYSDTAIAFFGAYFKVQQLIVMTVNGLIQGCLPVMRFNYGAGSSETAAFRFPIRNCFGHRHDDTGNVGCHPFSGTDFGIVYSVGSHALFWNIRYADYGDKLSVLRSFYYDFHLFSGHRKSRFQHGNSIMQATAFPCSILMVSGQMVPSERNLACIPCRGNRHLACCSHNDGLVSP